MLHQVVTQVDKIHDANAGRWESLLWYMHALVYHGRKVNERGPLADFICSSVRKANQPEVITMNKTIAEAIKEEGMEEGAIEGRRDFFLLLLRERFKTVPESVVAEVQATKDIHQFDVWGSAFAKARTIADIPFKARG